MIIVGGILTCVAGILFIVRTIEDVYMDIDAILILTGVLGGIFILAGIFIALSYIQIIALKQKINSLERRIRR